MSQFIHTIGHLKPSYVTQMFWMSRESTTLQITWKIYMRRVLLLRSHHISIELFHQMRDVEKLNLFIKSEDSVEELKFKVETVIRFFRAANYHEHPMYGSRKRRQKQKQNSEKTNSPY
ncbi:hypothetical protein RYX36_004022 [Vicia faba]